MIQSNAFESNASANANADESNANASANASAAKESSASANANAAFALAFANASAFEHKPGHCLSVVLSSRFRVRHWSDTIETPFMITPSCIDIWLSIMLQNKICDYKKNRRGRDLF